MSSLLLLLSNYATLSNGQRGTPITTTQVFQVSKDTQVSSIVPTRNYGISPVILDASTQKMLIAFDISSIPATAVCNNVILKLYHGVSGSATGFTLSAYSIASGNNGWPEGTKDSAAGGAGDCCWNSKDQAASPTAWAGSAGLSTANTDYETTVLGTISGNRSDGVGVEYSMSLDVARVGGWFGSVNTNYGLLIAFSVGVASGGFCTKSHATVAYRPTLTVTYTTNP